MLSHGRLSPTVQAIAGILEPLSNDITIETAVLCTEDGLPIHPTNAVGNQMAALAGFMAATAYQAFAMIGLKNNHELLVYQEDGTFLVCRPFVAGKFRLILAIILRPNTPYKRLINQIIKDIQQIMEKAQWQ